MNSIKIGSFNVRGIHNQEKRLKIFKYLKETNFGAVLLQETHSTIKDESLWQTQWGGKIVFSHGTSQSKGVTTLFKNKVNFKVNYPGNQDKHGRLVSVEIIVEGKKFRIFNIYAPNEDSPSFFYDLGELLHAARDEAFIIGGDFNLVLDVKKDKYGGKQEQYKPNAHKVLSQVIEQFQLCDLW